MELQDVFTKDHEAFLSAFVEVAKMLCPTAMYDRIEDIRSLTDSGSVCHTIVYGYDEQTELDVEVKTYQHPTEGLQIVVEHRNERDDIIYTHSVWFFSFNWKGLKATAKLR